jgi:hypothetical protein
MPNCKDITLLIIKNQELKLSFYDRFKMYFHVFVVCKLCKLFYLQSNSLHRRIHQLSSLHHKDVTDYTLTEEQKRTLQTKIDKEITRN